MKKYKLLLADNDGTLMDFHAAEGKALHGAAAAMGLSLRSEEEALYRQINAEVWRAYERREVTQEELRLLRFSRFISAMGFSVDAEEMAQAFMDALSKQTDEIDGAFDFISKAAERVPVIMVTNGIASVQRARLAASRMTPYIQGIVISGEIGAAKPDPKMIYAALEMGGASAADALMLGDEPRADIAAANAASVDSCWLNPTDRVNETQHAPTYQVSTLQAVLQWL